MDVAAVSDVTSSYRAGDGRERGWLAAAGWSPEAADSILGMAVNGGKLGGTFHEFCVSRDGDIRGDATSEREGAKTAHSLRCTVVSNARIYIPAA